MQEVCKSIFAWNSAQYVEAEQNKYYERKKGRNYISRQACFVNRFTLQGFNIYVCMYVCISHLLKTYHIYFLQLSDQKMKTGEMRRKIEKIYFKMITHLLIQDPNLCVHHATTNSTSKNLTSARFPVTRESRHTLATK